MGFIDKQTDLIDDAYENFIKSYTGKDNEIILPPLDYINDDGNLMSKNQFITNIKYDYWFSKKWGITIETKELSRKERSEYYYKHGNSEGIVEGSLDRPTFEENDVAHKWYNDRNTPKRVITITYNGQTQEIYE
jgi:hypothetical protein